MSFLITLILITFTYKLHTKWMSIRHSSSSGHSCKIRWHLLTQFFSLVSLWQITLTHMLIKSQLSSGLILICNVNSSVHGSFCRHVNMRTRIWEIVPIWLVKYHNAEDLFYLIFFLNPSKQFRMLDFPHFISNSKNILGTRWLISSYIILLSYFFLVIYFIRSLDI